MDASPSSEILNLDTKRQALEIEAKAITDELTQPNVDNDGKQTKPMGIDTPLVDEEGYPRSDIDVYRARGLRKRLNEIRYDHKSIMKQIESALSSNSYSSSSSGKNVAPSKVSLSKSTSTTIIDDDELTARRAPKPKPRFDKATGKWVVCNWDGTVAGVENGHLRSFENLDSTANLSTANGAAAAALKDVSVEKSLETLCNIDDTRNIPRTTETSTVQQQATTCDLQPFATINEIADNSPAARGGLKLNDAVLQIGSINHTNHRDLQAVGEAVNGAFLEGAAITFVVQRNNDLSSQSQQQINLNINVKPGRWEGNGILGCRIVKVK